MNKVSIDSLDDGQHVAQLVMTAVQQSEVAACLFRPDDSIAFISPGFTRIMNVPPEARTFYDIVSHCQATHTGVNVEGDLEEWMERATARRRSCENRTFETDMLDGRWYMVTETNVAGGWLWVMFTDITFLKSTESMLRLAHDVAKTHAETDDLTGLYNRRFAMSHLAACLARCAEQKTCCTIALIDLDFFKAINDRWGHDAGDQVLQDFAHSARMAVGAAGAVCRIGGEEFLLIMPDAPVRITVGLLDRLKSTLKPLIYGKDAIGYTFSAGLAANVVSDSPHALMKAADDALYRAKTTGRNRNVVA